MRTPLISALLSVFLLSGCIHAGSSSFRDMSTAYRDVLETYANDNILLNIVRASQRMPMSFLDLPSVVGSGNVSAGVGVGATVISASPNTTQGFFTAGVGSSTAPQASLSVNNGFNFTQSSLDNSSFMVSFLSDLKPDAIDSLMNSDTGPLSILYSLVIDYIEVRDGKNNVLEKFTNNPDSPKYEDFQKALYRLIDSGLKTEVVLEKQVLSAPMDVETLNKNMTALVAAYALPGTAVIPADTPVNGKPAFQLVRVNQQVRMCLQRTDTEKLVDAQFTDAAFCNSAAGGIGTRAAPTKSDKKDGQADNKKSLIIKMRSTRNIFDFLGQLLNMQNGPEPRIIRVKNSDIFKFDRASLTAPMDEKNSAPLFLVEKNKNTSNPITAVNYRGNSYAIPSQNNGATSMIIVILSEILTLNKVPGSIPPSPAVLIR